MSLEFVFVAILYHNGCLLFWHVRQVHLCSTLYREISGAEHTWQGVDIFDPTPIVWLSDAETSREESLYEFARRRMKPTLSHFSLLPMISLTRQFPDFVVGMPEAQTDCAESSSHIRYRLSAKYHGVYCISVVRWEGYVSATRCHSSALNITSQAWHLEKSVIYEEPPEQGNSKYNTSWATDHGYTSKQEQSQNSSSNAASGLDMVSCRYICWSVEKSFKLSHVGTWRCSRVFSVLI